LLVSIEQDHQHVSNHAISDAVKHNGHNICVKSLEVVVPHLLCNAEVVNVAERIDFARIKCFAAPKRYEMALRPIGNTLINPDMIAATSVAMTAVNGASSRLKTIEIMALRP
jgi:hypothetical protein